MGKLTKIKIVLEKKNLRTEKSKINKNIIWNKRNHLQMVKLNNEENTEYFELSQYEIRN